MKKIFGLLVPFLAFANPSGEKVVAGSCEVHRSATVMDVQQNSDRAIIEWGDFSISHGEFTQFHQPSSTSAILNRVVGNQFSEIHGHIKSNGLVYLINQNGILVGPNGRIKTGGFLASTLNVANGEFLEAGEMRFSGDSDAGLTLKGELWSPKGNVFLISKTIEHSGNILAPEGEVYGLAGTEVILHPEGEAKFIRISGEGTLDNSGMIEAIQTELRSAGGEIDTLAINHSGIIHANGFEEREGRIILQGENQGIVKVTGEIAASNGDTGGTVHILGEYVQLLDEAKVDVSGELEGGIALIGGDYKGQNPDIPNSRSVYVGQDVRVNADAISTGDGGKVIFWGDELNWFFGNVTACGGSESGNGGFVEISSLGNLVPKGLVNTLAQYGESGTLLFDPVNITFGAGNTPTITFPAVWPPPPPPPALVPDPVVFTFRANTTISATDLATLLGFNNVVLDANNGAGVGGQIVFDSPMAWSSNTLMLTSANSMSVVVDAAVTMSGTAAFTVNSADDFSVLMSSSLSNSGSGAISILAAADALFTGSTTISGSGSLTSTSTGNTTLTNFTLSGSGNANINSSANINVVNNPIATTALTLSGSGDANLTASNQVNVGSSTMTSPVVVGTSSGSLNIVSAQRTLVQGATASAGIRVIDFSAMTCTGNVSIQANAAGTTAGSFDGALILNSSIVSYDGDINITSVSGTAGGNFGLYFRRSATSGTERIQAGGTAAPFGSGNVNINATGRATANDAIRIGFNIFGAANQITGTSGSGNLTITANAANGDGIQLINDGSINFISGTGDILITATSTGPAGRGYVGSGTTNNITAGGSVTLIGTSSNHRGMQFWSTDIDAGANGNVTLTRTGGGGFPGIRIAPEGAGNSQLEVTVVNGNATINGTGGRGIEMVGSGSATRIEATGTGNVTVMGTGTTSEGMLLTATGLTPVFITNSGTLTMTGTGPTNGIRINGNPARLRLTSTSGDVNVTGTGSTAAGLDFIDTDINPGSGTANVTAISNISPALVIGTNNLIGGGGTTGDVIVTADTLTVDPTSSFNTPANLTLQPLNAATSIGLGTGSGTFNLTDAELDTIGVSALPSEVIIGRSNGAHTIDVNNTTPLNPTTYMFRGNGISVDNFDIVANPLNLNIGQLGAGIANIGNTITSGTITVTGNGTADNNTLQAQDIINTWNVNGAGVIDFTNVGNLVGGTNDDTFVFADGAGTSGLVDGGAPAFTNSLDYTNFTTPAIVQFIGPFDGIASNIGGDFFNICCLIGNTIAPPVPNIPITFQNQVEVELAFKYLFLNGKNDDFFVLWQIYLLSQTIAYPNALWSNIAGAVLYQTLSGGLNRLEKWELEQEGVPPIVRAQFPHFVQ